MRATWNPNPGKKISFDYFASDEFRRGGVTGAAFDEPANLAAIAKELLSLRQVAALKWD